MTDTDAVTSDRTAAIISADASEIDLYTDFDGNDADNVGYARNRSTRSFLYVIRSGHC